MPDYEESYVDTVLTNLHSVLEQIHNAVTQRPEVTEAKLLKVILFPIL